MPKGGHARSGPAPDPTALRRDRDKPGEWIDLPASGREGPPPEWPLATQAKREAELWASEWRRPQALMWERNGQELEVAIYVRTLRKAESPKASVALGTLLARQMEGLGLTVPGLHRNRWRIADEKPASRKKKSSSKARLRVVGE